MIGSISYNHHYGRIGWLTPIEFMIPSLRISVKKGMKGSEWVDHFLDLEKLDEVRMTTLQEMIAKKKRRKAWYDRQLKLKEEDLSTA